MDDGRLRNQQSHKKKQKNQITMWGSKPVPKRTNNQRNFSSVSSKSLRLVLIGVPVGFLLCMTLIQGSGKGTQAEKIQRDFRCTPISTGNLLRQEIRANSPLATQIKKQMEGGGLVADELVLEIAKKSLSTQEMMKTVYQFTNPSFLQGMGIRRLSSNIESSRIIGQIFERYQTTN